MREIHPIGTRLYRPTHIDYFKDYECEVMGYEKHGRNGAVSGYILHWKKTCMRNSWTLSGVHGQMKVYQQGITVKLPDELFTL